MSLLNTTSKHRGFVSPAQDHPAHQEILASIWSLALFSPIQPSGCPQKPVSCFSLTQEEETETPRPSKARGKVIWCPRKLELKSLFLEFLLLFGFSGCLGQLQAPIIE